MKKMQVVLMAMLLGISGSVFGQAGGPDSLTSSSDSTIIGIVDIEPSFKGGLKQLQNWLDKHLSYPPEAREAGIEGTVYVEFVVEKNGSVSFDGACFGHKTRSFHSEIMAGSDHGQTR